MIYDPLTSVAQRTDQKKWFASVKLVLESGFVFIRWLLDAIAKDEFIKANSAGTNLSC